MSYEFRNKVAGVVYLALLTGNLILNTSMYELKMKSLGQEEIALMERKSAVLNEFKESVSYKEYFIEKNREGLGQLLRDDITRKEYLDLLDSYKTEEGIEIFARELNNELVVNEIEVINEQFTDIQNRKEDGFSDYVKRQFGDSAFLTLGYLLLNGTSQVLEERDNKESYLG